MLFLQRSSWILCFAVILIGAVPLVLQAESIQVEKDLGKLHLDNGMILIGKDLRVSGDTVYIDLEGNSVHAFSVDEMAKIYYSDNRHFNSVGAVTGGVITLAAYTGLTQSTIGVGMVLLTGPPISAAVGILTGYLTPRLLEDAGFDAEHWQLLYSKDEPAKKNNDE
ncbi:MAG: hypothetical protein K9N46_09600 [Candidatus Marinimicrobia bacterium]|nr:hypothetical protein [Candidatus Neomarinimicrobiota bacterium]MCF7828427.1 hypothetical protein [Candidatus Neomarinimicrobiota bacterium]MCF7880979.1 hypothetical protein [Candidatus Neomarinimicrobiota bacterium]